MVLVLVGFETQMVSMGHVLVLIGIESQMVNMVNMRWQVLVLVGFETQVVNMFNIGGMSCFWLGLRPRWSIWSI